ncbi:MAG: hypothetical protein ACRD3C_12220 [Vicinamibacterales bacterium]
MLHSPRLVSSLPHCQAGQPAHVVAERLGHKRIDITLDIYAHVLPDMQQDAARRLNALLYGR